MYNSSRSAAHVVGLSSVQGWSPVPPPGGLVTVLVKKPTLVGFLHLLPVFPGCQGWSCPLVFPHRAPLFEGFGFHRRVTKFFTVLKKCPSWRRGKDYTQQFWIRCGLSRMSSYWRRPANLVPVFPDCQNVFLNNCRVVSASLMLQSITKGIFSGNDFL